VEAGARLPQLGPLHGRVEPLPDDVRPREGLPAARREDVIGIALKIVEARKYQGSQNNLIS
jgi:hypothetical protein